MFTTTELRVLAGLLNDKTISQVGEDLRLSHPSVSKTLRAAERRAGFPLVEQRGRRLRLTAGGKRIATAAQDALAEMRRIDRLLSEIRGGASGGLRVVATSTICNYVLPPVVGEFLSGVQDVDLQIQAMAHGPDVWALFDTGDFDIAISRSLPPPHVIASHLLDDQLCLCVAPGSDLAERADIHWQDISGAALIGPIGEEPMWGQFSLLGIQARSRVRVSDVALAKRLVEAGHAIALLYRIVALEEATAGRILMLPLPDAPVTISYWMAARHGPASPLADRFRGLLREHAGRLASSDAWKA